MKELNVQIAKQEQIDAVPATLRAAHPNATPEASPTSTPSEYLTSEACAAVDFVIVKQNWEKGGFDTVALWHVTIKNITNRPIGNFDYVTSYASETGIIHKSNTGTLEKRLEPGQTRTFEINDGFIDSQVGMAAITFAKAEFLGSLRPTRHNSH